MSQRTALIVGAGIGGLAAAIALQRAGWRARVFERAASPRELGFALNVAANAMAALQELGVADRVLAEGHRTELAEIRRGDGHALKRVHLADTLGLARAIVATRPALHGALLDAVDPDSLVLGSEAVGFDATGPDATVVLTSGVRESGDVLIGADGVSSAIRRQLHPAEPPPRASGYYAVRGVAYDAESLMGDLSAATYLGDGIEASIARAGARAVYWYMSLLATEVTGDLSRPRDVAGRFAERLDDTFRAMVAATRPEDTRIDAICERDPLKTWGSGPVTLLGDAAHPMLPHTGQGAAQAIEDAVALGIVLAGAGDVAGALRHYERVRLSRTNALIARGRRAARATTTRNSFVIWLRSALIRAVPAGRMAAMFMLADGRDPHRDLRTSSRTAGPS